MYVHKTRSFLEQLYKENVPKYSFSATTKHEWEIWRDNLKKVFIDKLGGFPEKEQS